MSTVTADTKLQGEDIILVIDFLSRLLPGESVQTCASTISVLSGGDSNPTTMIPLLPAISGSSVHQQVIDGIAGNIYLVSIAVRTSLNNIYINEVKLAVLSSVNLNPA